MPEFTYEITEEYGVMSAWAKVSPSMRKKPLSSKSF